MTHAERAACALRRAAALRWGWELAAARGEHYRVDRLTFLLAWAEASVERELESAVAAGERIDPPVLDPVAAGDLARERAEHRATLGVWNAAVDELSAATSGLPEELESGWFYERAARAVRRLRAVVDGLATPCLN